MQIHLHSDRKPDNGTPVETEGHRATKKRRKPVVRNPEQYKKSVATMKERYGEDYYSRIAKHDNQWLKGNSDAMRDLVNKRWAKYREEKKNGGN